MVSLSDEVAATERAIRPQTVALAVFAALVGFDRAGGDRPAARPPDGPGLAEFPILRALGMTPASLAVLSLARLAVVTVAGAVVAVAVAVAASPLMPVGLARLAEPHPGIEVNIAVLVAGLAAIAVLPLAVLAPAARRAAGRAPGPLGVAEPQTHAALPAGLGAGHGRVGDRRHWGADGVRAGARPDRGAGAQRPGGHHVAMAAVVAALVFGASLIALVGTPHRYGQNWNQELDLQFGGVSAAFGAKVLSGSRASPGTRG